MVWNDIMFNQRESALCLVSIMQNPLYVCQNIKLTLMSKVKHLGNVLNSQLNDKDDIIWLLLPLNKIIMLLDLLPSHMVDILFHTYYYGSQLSNLDGNFIKSIM